MEIKKGNSKKEFVEFKVKYNPDFLAEFKEKVPPKDRRWDPIKKVWRVRKEYKELVQRLIDKHF